MAANGTQRARRSESSPEEDESGIQNERVLVLVFEAMKWDIRALCSAASVNRRLRAVAKRLLWRELCSKRAPKMAAALAPCAGRMGGGWHTLAKLMFFCCGSGGAETESPGHFAAPSRFSKTSGRSFLPRGCRGDVLYVSDPCEHRVAEGIRRGDLDLGVYRGVFEGFARSRTRACLVGRRAELEKELRCPYCGSRVWSMAAASLVPRSAARRLGSRHSGLDYFVCVNGHLHGVCWLVPLSDDDDEEDGG